MKKLLSALVIGLFLFGMAGIAKANTYSVDISSPTTNVTYLADFTAQGFDPSTEQVISGSLYLMVKASYRDDVSFTIRLENNEHESLWVDDRYYRALRLTLEDFTLIDEDGTIEYIVTTYSGWGYIGAGAFTIETEPIGTTVDDDGDGYFTPEDCDDTDPSINPGASESCNGIDDNCDGVIDEGLDTTDADGDTYPACNDCDDTNPNINPFKNEVCNGIDDNCDGEIDEGEGDIGDACHVYAPYTWMTDIAQCSEDGIGGVEADFRGIRFAVNQDFSAIELRVQGYEPGTFAFDAELRRSTGFDVEPEQIHTEIFVDVSGEERLTPFTTVRLKFKPVAVSEETTFTLKFVNISGDSQLLFEAFEPGSDDCKNIEVTEINFGTNPNSIADVAGFRVLTESFVLESPFAREAPVMDGEYGKGEWPNIIGNRIDLQNGFLRVANDNARLYVVLDLTEDSGNDAFDSFELTFDVDGDGLITPGVDLNYTLNPASANANIRYQYYLGEGSLSAPLEPETFSSVARGYDCYFGDGTRVETSSPFPESSTCSQHRLWEIAIDLKEIGSVPGDTLRMGVSMVSVAPFFAEEIPIDFTYDFSNLISVELSADPVDHLWPNGDVIFEDNAIEFTQAIQTRDNSLPLVKDKDTAARVYAYTMEGGLLDYRYSLVSLFAKKGGEDLPGSPMTLYHLAPMLRANPNSLSGTANFKLPSTWDDGVVRFSAVIRGISPGTPRVDSTPINITYTQKKIPLYWNIQLNTGTEEVPELGTFEVMDISEDYLKTVYPLADVNIVRKPWQEFGTIRNGIDAAIEDLNDYYSAVFMGWMFGAVITGEEPFDLPDQVYGTAGITLGGIGGCSDPIWAISGALGKVAFGTFAPSSREGVMAHEINHNLDPAPFVPNPTVPEYGTDGTWGRHVGNPANRHDTEWGCGASGGDPAWPWETSYIQDAGFDVREPWIVDDGIRSTIIPNTIVHDLMSYCANPDDKFPTKWVSPYRWQHLFDSFETIEPASLMSSNESVAVSEIFDVYYISGKVNKDGTGKLDPIVKAPGDAFFPNVADGMYNIILQDDQGATLQSSSFNANFDLSEVIDSADENPFVNYVSFNFRMPVIAGQSIAAVTLTKDDIAIDQIPVSLNPPQVTLVSPNGGESLVSLGTISWVASDADGDTLTFSLFYSPNNGSLWKPIALNIQDTQYDASNSFIPGGLNALVRVVATDGFHTATDDSDAIFIVAQNPPQVMIAKPQSGDEFSAEKTIDFCGNAIDPEDENLADDAYLWFLNGKALGAGKCIKAALPAGLQDITLQATDSNGAQDQAIVSIEVIDANIWNEDQDGDLYIYGEDCDDNDPAINPGAVEVCEDGKDNDCDGDIDQLGCNDPPDCFDAMPSISEIWPPNHKMVDINILGITDPDGDPVNITIDAITQDEPVNDESDGDTSPDGDGVSTDTAQVRAERSGGGNGRMYEISFTTSDDQGGECEGSVQVCVPHDRRKWGECIDDGQIYDSTIP